VSPFSNLDMLHGPIIRRFLAYLKLEVIFSQPLTVLIIFGSNLHQNETLEVKDFSNTDLINQWPHPNALPSPAYVYILSIVHAQMACVYNQSNVLLLNNDS
jgi:hypothetical protein